MLLSQGECRRTGSCEREGGGRAAQALMLADAAAQVSQPSWAGTTECGRKGFSSREVHACSSPLVTLGSGHSVQTCSDVSEFHLSGPMFSQLHMIRVQYCLSAALCDGEGSGLHPLS